MKKLFTVFLFFFSAITLAQQEAVDIARNRFSNEKAIFLLKDHTYKVYKENNQVKITSTVHEQMFINKEAGIPYQSRSVSTSDFVEAKNIKAYTLLPKNKKYVKKEAEQIILKSDLGKYSFYDDQKVYEVTYPFVEVGAITDIAYDHIFHEPRFFGSFYFADYLPVVQNNLTITVKKGIEMEYKLFNCDSMNINFEKVESKNETTYKWSIKEAEKISFLSDAPNFRYYEPHIAFYVKRFEDKGAMKNLLSNPADLYAWYTDIQKNLNKTKDDKLKFLTDSLVAGLNSEMEKVKKIYYWVQDKISYVAFEDGLGGYVPRDAGLVCSRRFGDCKDMASLIQEMLGMAGIKSYLTWIGSRDIPYTYQDLPTPMVDNHMIATYIDEQNNFYFLDGTGKNAPLELYTSMIQGKEALVGLSADSFLIVTVPVKEPDINQTTDSVTLRINNNLVVCNGKVSLTGYDRLEYYYRTQSLNQEKANDYFKSYFAKGNNKTTFSNIKVVEDNREQPYTITYDFELPDYINTSEDELYINLNLEKGQLLENIEEDRMIPVNFKHLTKKSIITTMIIPDGYTVQFVPRDAEYHTESCGYSSKYVQKENTVIHVNEFYIKTLMLPKNQFANCNKMLRQMVKSNKEVVTLKKK